MELSEKLKYFIKNQNWIFAKTYSKTWPHEYIVQEQVDNDLSKFILACRTLITYIFISSTR